MTRKPLLLLTALLAVGCSTPGPSVVPPDNQATVANRPVEPLGGITFRAMSPANAQYLGTVGRSTPTGSPGATDSVTTPQAPPSATSPAAPGGASGVAVSGNMWGYYGYGYYFGPTDGVPMALVSLTEGDAPGSRGPLQPILTGIVAPVLKDWAADAHLVASNANLGNDGLIAPTSPTPDGMVKPAMPYYGGPNGWQLTYVAPSRHEVITFQVTPEKTLVIRARWAPLHLAAAPVTFDSDAAVQKLIAAIEDRNFKSEEETTGKDYFLGTAFDPVAMNPVSPDTRVEVVYDVPDNARWYASLQSILGKLVWELSFSPSDPVLPIAIGRPTDASMPVIDPGFYFDNSARGLIDAQTGTVIRFSRPSKRYYTPVNPPPIEPKPIPSPRPSPSASAS